MNSIQKNKQAWADFKEGRTTRDQLIKALRNIRNEVQDTKELGRKYDGIRKGDPVFSVEREADEKYPEGIIRKIEYDDGEKSAVWVEWFSQPPEIEAVDYDYFRERWDGKKWVIEY